MTRYLWLGIPIGFVLMMILMSAKVIYDRDYFAMALMGTFFLVIIGMVAEFVQDIRRTKGKGADPGERSRPPY